MVLDFGLLDSGLFQSSSVSGEGLGADAASSIIWNDVGVGIVPIGAVVAWCKSLVGVPAALLPNWVECNGQVLADLDSPLNGQTIPDLNTNAYFLRGLATSGTTGGASGHTHNLNSTGNERADGTLAYWRSTTASGSTIPPFYSVVWIMRIK
jgi:hypothetical protein